MVKPPITIKSSIIGDRKGAKIRPGIGITKRGENPPLSIVGEVMGGPVVEVGGEVVEIGEGDLEMEAMVTMAMIDTRMLTRMKRSTPPTGGKGLTTLKEGNTKRRAGTGPNPALSQPETTTTPTVVTPTIKIVEGAEVATTTVIIGGLRKIGAEIKILRVQISTVKNLAHTITGNTVREGVGAEEDGKMKTGRNPSSRMVEAAQEMKEEISQVRESTILTIPTTPTRGETPT